MEIHVKDPGSALTHFIGMIAAIGASMPLIFKAFTGQGKVSGVACSIFMASMILLYGASTAYHTFDISEKVNLILKKIDHMMISVLIAGSYTPICLLVLDESVGIPLLIVVWSIAIIGILFKLFWVTCPKWVSSILYIGMGWACVAAFSNLWTNLPVAAFVWLLIGGIFYTIGGVIYALKLKLFNAKHKYFGSHEVFHVFVLLGSMCHFVVMFCFVA
ncbi:MAG: hemolysin III family protein [Lachnospiraceae bacterium]